MFGIDTCQEWLLAIFELLAIIIIAALGVIGAVGMLLYYLGKTIWHWDLNYFREDV